MYEYDALGPDDMVADCYALNVAGDHDVWCYYYMDFPLVHLRKKRIVASWPVPVSGSHAFAVAGEYALFAGAYDKRDAFQLVHLARDGTSALVDEFELIGADGVPVRPVRTVGRGAMLHVLGEGMLYEIDLHYLLATNV